MSIQRIINQNHQRPLMGDQLNECGLTAVCIFNLTGEAGCTSRWFDDERCDRGALQVALDILAKQPDKFKVAEHRYTRRTGKEVVMFYLY